MVLPPKDHPRYKSLLAREKLVEASDVVAKQGLIAHGRGEAFDYLLGEQTCLPALSSIKAACSALLAAKNPVISVNGNVVALAAREVARLAEVSGAKVEVNLFHRTPERVTGLTKLMKNVGVDALGENADDLIPGLNSERAKCCSDGIGSADVVLVPLEDGDRCEALVNMGKQVIAIDLNPLSRTAKMATVTIVDEISRVADLLLEYIINKEQKSIEWNNQGVLDDALKIIAKNTIS